MAKRTRNPEATRGRILRAAEEIVVADGVGALTLDRAADRAGVSKGGVLYHYACRNDLVSAMVERTASGCEASIGRYRTALGATFTQAYVAEGVSIPADDEQRRAERVGAALLAASAAEPELLAPMRAAFADWQQRIESESADPVLATVARLAADGLWLCELFGIDGLAPDLRERVVEELRRMAGAAGATADGTDHSARAHGPDSRTD